MKHTIAVVAGCAPVRTLRVAIARHSTLVYVSAVAIMFSLFVWNQQAEAQRVGGAVSAAEPRWLALLVGVHFVVLLVAAMSYRLAGADQSARRRLRKR
ncbi:MAG TPA: hypothetical protein VMM78_07215 [Thermomicrobiales bacterium]|nr:hypothetical protein [Thermomicrobiales bacterium]